ncbi:ABC transporter ATP-binding protein [Thalassomonas viridans]|uniref:ABC transporter ATP-binding protein n=1 Tax=Thalassomonas viridans TaxID=137584 RepID=A0AAF0C8P2_9GAMM|nr:ABC transporter ATP-binding protein [Thalassomonas viridans]WDE04395.1 ABC transporter ATP-binding protein [Thalassomonas viridans]
MQTELIQIKDMSFRYPKAQVDTLKNIDLTINSGDYIAIVGTSGSGKSTLLSILGLLNQPTRGEYLILGKNTGALTNTSISLLKNHEIGFIFQNFNILNQLNVFDNVALPLSYNPEIKRSEYHNKVSKALEQVRMLDYIKRLPSQLSGGQQQRVAIARALVNEPSLILADEPTGNLDSKNSQQVFDLLESLNRNGKTICLITHDQDYAKRAKQQWLITDGQLQSQ